MNNKQLSIEPKLKPILDPDYVPAILWTRAYNDLCNNDPESTELAIALSRKDGTVFVHKTRILSHTDENIALNNKYIERLIKFLLWQKGGSKITIGGCEPIAEYIASVYSPTGERIFDYEFIGAKMFLEQMSIESCNISEMPEANEKNVSLGRNLDGCRIGFDLGGSDRKAAAVIDGEVVFSEEIEWDPYFEKDPNYHYAGIMDSLKRAAAKLPRVDAIGGSAAGCYVNNEVRAGSLFRGVSDEDFEKHVRDIFHKIKKEWNDVPFEVANDGEVTALAGSMSLKQNAVLGIAMGTSVAAGYCDSNGHITPWINELAFVPVDYREDAPADEWSGDIGCGVQYFCQQGIARLVPAAGIDLPADMPFPEQLIEVQKLMAANDDRARKIYETVGTCFGYAIAYFAEFYEIKNLLLLGRVTSGEGGQIIIDKTEEVLKAEFPELAEKISISTPDEQLKRHGQAIAAASLPAL
jgi:predicted NBD/HSP70 family sugar kinase